MRTTRILPACGAGSVCAQLSGRDSLSVYCVLRARRLRHRRRIARGSQEQSATAARRHLDSRTAMGPVRRAPPTARLDALAAGPATARSGRPYPRQAPRKAPAGSPVVRCCSTSRVVASQDVCEVARGAGRVEKYTDTVEWLGRRDALYIFV